MDILDTRIIDEASKLAIERIKADYEADQAAGRVRFGGPFWGTDLRRSYLEAARTVFNDAAARNQLASKAQPCLHLQRHALELMIKHVIDAATEIPVWKKVVEAFKADPVAAAKGPRPEFQPLIEHDLSKLMNVARTRLATVSVRIVLPTEMVALVDELAAFEDGDETRFRYHRGKQGKKGQKGKYADDSFPDVVKPPIGDWQARLESLFEQHLGVRERFWELPSMNLGEELYVWDESLSQQIFDLERK